MTVDSIITDKFLEVMASSNFPNLKEKLLKFKRDEQKNEFIIPVLGVQGAGKSSFLNALLFNDIVLPVEVTETTCIPTEIYYAEVPSPEASVIFENGKEEKVPCNEDGLKQYVHQEFNPGNCKNVARVVIRMKHELLKTGLVIVDLPGVGSGTEENQTRTINYLQNSSGGIFLMAESLKTPDAAFISTALPILGNVFLVQNRWSGETLSDTKEAADYNHDKLKENVKELHIPVSQVPDFQIISVQNALNAVIKDDTDAYEKSGMRDFQKTLIDFAASWRNDMKTLHLNRLQELVGLQLNNICEKAASLKNDPVPEQEKLQQRQAQAEKEFAEKEELLRQAQEFLTSEQNALHSKFESMIMNVRGELRTAVRNLIDAGVTSGEQLNKAFNDHVSEQNNILFQNVYQDMMTITASLQERLAGLEIGQEFGKTNLSNQNSFSDKTQIHSTYEAVGSCIGIAAFVAASAIKGGLIGSSGGPLGMVIGGAIGVLCGLAGWLLGKGAKHVHVDNQKSAAMKELFDAVQKLCTDLRKKYNQSIDEYFTVLGNNINDWYSARRKMIEDEINGLLDAVRQSASVKAEMLKELNEQETYLKDVLKTIQEAK